MANGRAVCEHDLVDVDCPSEELVVEVLAGLTAPEVAAAFHRHVEQCDSCNAVLRALACAASIAVGSRPGQTAALTPRAITAGLRINQYELIRELGRGGMGVVWLARDTKLDRRVAMKFLLTASRGVARRFLVEARATAQCNHDN